MYHRNNYDKLRCNGGVIKQLSFRGRSFRAEASNYYYDYWYRNEITKEMEGGR